MSDANETLDAGEIDLSEADEEKMRALIRSALAGPEKSEPAPESDVLRGVQKRLRERSGGKFYDEGWSTAKHPPIFTYLITSIFMLIIVLLSYGILGLLSGRPSATRMTPEPVNISITPATDIPWAKPPSSASIPKVAPEAPPKQ